MARFRLRLLPRRPRQRWRECGGHPLRAAREPETTPRTARRPRSTAGRVGTA